MSLETELGEVIKKIRSIEGLTQVQLAELLGVSQGLIVKYESNQSKPGLDIIKKFKKEIGYDLTSDDITKVILKEPEPMAEPERVLQDNEQEAQSRRTLEKTLENMSADKLHSTEIIKMLAEDKLRNTAIFEKLAALLEKQFSSSSPDPVDQLPVVTGKIKDLPSGPGRLGLGKKKGQVNKS
jgi:transcriptional regulator with XRE-family HTH domain